MKQILIKVKNKGHWINKNLADATYEERFIHYNLLSKGQIVHLLEEVIGNNINKG
ncbi:hypothetical protein [Clostridium sp. FP1]|uniref:hypothetical protein n=1 Tax=Clostridium sp. FP1 TaxID=2724076 RepID=UPI0013E94EA5|nr:hypothetical protein [Clostridium sp. FP1]MBZ9633172.1 hypothetical protein [Clostridium sp. FP1]